MSQQPPAMDQIQQIRQRLEHFMTTQLRHCPPPQQREAVRNFALSLPAGLTLDQRHTLNFIFDECLRQSLHDIPVVNELCRLFFNSLPSPHDIPLEPWRSRIKRFAMNGLTGLCEGSHISIAIARFLKSAGSKSLSSLPYELRECLLFEFMWHLPSSPYRALTLSLFEGHLYENTGIIQTYIDDPEFIDGSYFGNSREDDLYGTSTPSLIHNPSPFHSLPDLFNLSDFDYGMPRPNTAPSHMTPVENDEAVNEIRDWASDLSTLDEAITHVRAIILELASTMGAADDPVKGTFAQLLITDDIIRPHPPEISANITLQQVSTLTEELRVVERHQKQIIQRLFRAENYIHIQEELLLGGDDKFIACASEYIRCECRKALECIIAALKTPRLRQIAIPSTAQHGSSNLTGCPYETDDPCPICLEDFGKHDNAPSTVTDRCCNRHFHSDCLLQWLKEKFLDYEENQEMTCPSCRTEIDAEYLRELFTQRL